MPTIRTVRRAVASVASIALSARFYQLYHRGHDPLAEALFTYATIAVPFVAGVLIWSRRLGAQLLARGAWWSLLLVGGLLAVTTLDEAQSIGALTAACAAAALLAVGATGLDDRPGFAPVAFRGTLLLALVLAMADTGAFSWLGAGNAVFDHSWSVLLMVPPMLAGIVGLIRLRTWGLFVSLGCNLAIVALASFGVLNLPGPVRNLFIGTAILQLIVPLPMIVSIIRRRPPNPNAWRRTRAIAPAVTVIAIAAVAGYAYLQHTCLHAWL